MKYVAGGVMVCPADTATEKERGLCVPWKWSQMQKLRLEAYMVSEQVDEISRTGLPWDGWAREENPQGAERDDM